jgi:hypothetical protein
MPLFDSNSVQSEEAAAILRTQEILSGLGSLQTLLEAVGNATTAKTLIIIGPLEPPYDNESYTIDELEDRIAWAQLFPQLSQDSLLVTRSRAVGATPEKEGFLRLHVRRQIRELEQQAPGGLTDAWLYLLDQTSRMCEQFVEAADLNLDNKHIKRVQGPRFNLKKDESSQGRYVFADFLIAWGGSEHDE